MSWARLDRPAPADDDLAPILAHLTHEILSVATAQAGLLPLITPLITDDPELADHLAVTISKLRQVADDLRIVRLGHTPPEPRQTVSLRQILDRVHHAYPHLSLTVGAQVDLTTRLSTTLYDRVTLVIRLVGSLTAAASTPITLSVRSRQPTGRLVVMIRRAGLDIHMRQRLRRLLNPTLPPRSLPVHAQLLIMLGQTQPLDLRIRIIRSVVMWRLALPHTGIAT